MTDQDKGHLFKIFSGPHAGAEIPIGRGTYTLGSDEECDIILSDPGVAARHIKLILSDDRTVVSKMEGAFYLDGEKAGEGETELAPFQIVTIGATHFGVGPAEDEWPHVTLPVLHPEEEPSDSEEEESPAEEWEEEAGERVVMPVAERTAQKKTGRIFLVAACGMLLLIVVVFILFSGNDHAGTRLPIQGQAAQKMVLQGMMKKPGLEDLRIESLKNGQLVLSGCVETGEQKKEIVRDLMGLDPPVRVRVNVISRLIGSAKGTLDALGLPLEVLSGGKGRIILRGYVREAGPLKRALEILRQDLPGISEIENRVLTQEDIIPALFDLMEPFALQGKIRLHTYPDHILATGTLKQKEREGWDRVKEAFTSRYGEVIQLKEDLRYPQTAVIKNDKPKMRPPGPGKEGSGLQSTATEGKKQMEAPRAMELDLPIEGVSIGAIRYVTFRDGTKYFEGGKLDNGYIIRSITRDRIILDNGSRQFNLFWGR